MGWNNASTRFVVAAAALIRTESSRSRGSGAASRSSLTTPSTVYASSSVLGLAVDEADLEVPISDAYELADTAKPHERLAEGHALGKIVLMVRNPTTLS